MSWFSAAWFSIGFGLCLAIVIVLAVVTDLLFIRWKMETISLRTLRACQYCPVLAGVIGLLLGAVIGVLLGHLIFPQVLIGP